VAAEARSRGRTRQARAGQPSRPAELRGRVRRTGHRITSAGGLKLIAALFLLPTITDALQNSSRTKVAVAGADAATVAALQRSLPERAPNGKPTIERGIDPRELSALPAIVVHDTDGKSVSEQSRTLVYALLLMRYMSVPVYGAAASSSIVQEKASRVTEVLLARVTPLEHMAGKLGGVGAAGLLQFAIWIAAALLILAVASLLGGSAGLELADVPAGTFIAFGAFFALGFTFYGALYAGPSAPASRIGDASAAGAVPGILIAASFLASTVALGDPESAVARVLSLTPMTMFTRVALGWPPWWEVVLSIALLLATIALVLVVAAKVYRVALLLCGTRPGLRGIARLVRSS
jgi:ABC-2 type transport system permease protein